MAALTMAASGAFLLVLRLTETFGRGSIFCSDTACAVEGVLWSLPRYAATLAPSLWTLSLLLTGVSIALTSLLLLPLRAPLPLVVLGWLAGVAVAAVIPVTAYSRTYAV